MPQPAGSPPRGNSYKGLVVGGGSPNPPSSFSSSSISRAFLSLVALLGIYFVAFSGGGAKVSDGQPTNGGQVRVPGGADGGEHARTTYNNRIVCIGDIHGDLPHLMRILRYASLVDLKGAWSGGTTTLVQTGDMVDRGRDTIALYRYFDNLRPQAEEAGGKVVNLLGNHEIMNAMGDWRYVTPEDIATFGGERARRTAMSTGWIGQTWRHNYSITARVPYTSPSFLSSTSSSLFSSSGNHNRQESFGINRQANSNGPSPFLNAAASFVHGGIIPRYIQSLGLTPSDSGDEVVDRINGVGRGLMEKLRDTGAQGGGMPPNANVEERNFWSAEGPMWDRSYALNEDEAALCAQAEEACNLLQVQTLIMGHTPSFEGMVSRCGGRVLLIDTGISRAYGGVLSALEINYTLTPLLSNPNFDAKDDVDSDRRISGSAAGNRKAKRAEVKENGEEKGRSWVEKEVYTALYAGKGREVMAHRERRVNWP